MSTRPLTLDVCDAYGMLLRITVAGRSVSISRCCHQFVQAALNCDSNPELHAQLDTLARQYIRHHNLLRRRTA
jgi:hypothetical protein